MTLTVKSNLLRVQARGDIFSHYPANMPLQFRGLLQRGQGMQIGYHKVAIIGFLHPDIIPHGTKIVAQMQESRRPDTTHDDFSIFFHKKREDSYFCPKAPAWKS